MINISAVDIIDYMPSIGKYSGYDRDVSVFDKYITESKKNLKRLLKLDSIDVDDTEIELDDNMRQLTLSYIVYKFYHEKSFNIENDRQMIIDLRDIYNEN